MRLRLLATLTIAAAACVLALSIAAYVAPIIAEVTRALGGA